MPLYDSYEVESGGETFLMENENKSLSGLHNPLVDEISIPMPFHDSYEVEGGGGTSPTENEAPSDEGCKLSACHGTAVKICENGRVIITSAQVPLDFWTSRTQARKISSFGGTPQIYFSTTDIEIRINELVVYTKPIERLLGYARDHSRQRLKISYT